MFDFGPFFDQVRGECDRRQAAAVEGLQDFAGELLDRAKAAAPVASGELRDSGRIADFQETPSGAEVSIEFTASHAAAVHEGDGNGQKFLERTMRAGADEMAEFVGQRME